VCVCVCVEGEGVGGWISVLGSSNADLVAVINYCGYLKNETRRFVTVFTRAIHFASLKPD
jgi:hypothetical protein